MQSLHLVCTPSAALCICRIAVFGLQSFGKSPAQIPCAQSRLYHRNILYFLGNDLQSPQKAHYKGHLRDHRKSIFVNVYKIKKHIKIYGKLRAPRSCLLEVYMTTSF